MSPEAPAAKHVRSDSQVNIKIRFAGMAVPSELRPTS